MINLQNLKKYISSDSFKGFMIAFLVAIFVLVIFQFGVFVGYRKAFYADRFGNNFSKNFMGPRGGNGMMMDLPGKGLMPEGHGSVGEIISLNPPKMVVADKNFLEKIIIMNNETEIRKFRQSISQNELKVGDHVIVLGSPDNEGNINAKLIRILPPPQEDNLNDIKN